MSRSALRVGPPSESATTAISGPNSHCVGGRTSPRAAIAGAQVSLPVRRRRVRPSVLQGSAALISAASHDALIAAHASRFQAARHPACARTQFEYRSGRMETAVAVGDGRFPVGRGPRGLESSDRSPSTTVWPATR